MSTTEEVPVPHVCQDDVEQLYGEIILDILAEMEALMAAEEDGGDGRQAA